MKWKKRQKMERKWVTVMEEDETFPSIFSIKVTKACLKSATIPRGNEN
jgi:hypothetical protein